MAVLDRRAGPLLALLLAALAVALLAGWQLLTGDETRYLMYAVSVLRHGRFTMDLPEWQALYQAATGTPAAGLPMGDNQVLMLHGPYLAALLSPVGWLAGLAGLRLVALLAGLAGLACLFTLCRRVASPGVALLATAVVALTVPLLPYLHLFYMEAFLFAAVAGAWLRVQHPGRGLGGDLVTALLLLCIPFVHLRGAVVAAVLYAALLWRLWRAGHKGRAALLVALGGIAFALLVGANLAVFGVVTGSVNSARPPMPWEWPDVLAMQAFNVRHGLLAYAPVWLLGLAGLLAGAARGAPLARQGLGLLLVATATGMGVNPGECWPARFWVLSMPMLGVGLALAWQALRPMRRFWLAHAAGLALLAVTLVNSAVFFAAPNAFLENRQSAITYQRLFDRTGGVNPGLMLPVETGGAEDVAVARGLAVAALAVALSLAAATRRPLLAAPAVLLLLAGADLSRVARLVPVAESAPDRLHLALDRPIAAGYVQMGRYWETWYAPPGLPLFDVTAVGGAGTWVWHVPANQVVAVSCRGLVHQVTIGTQGGGVDLAEQSAFRLNLYRSRSWIRSWLPATRGAC